MNHSRQTATSWASLDAATLSERWRIPSLAIYDVVASTNDEAARLAEQGAPAGTVVLSDVQSAGRGRSGRPWHASAGDAILVSIVFRPERGAADPSVLPLRVGLAAASALRDTARVDARIKWPNDLVINDLGKIGGILCEGASTGSKSWVVAGIGLNVTQQCTDFDASVRGEATSVAIAGGATDRVALLGALLDGLRPFLVKPPPLDAATLAGLEALDALKGRAITIDGEPAGVADGIASDGSLRILTASGSRRVRSGTVRFAASDSFPDDLRQGPPESNAETRS